MNKGFNAPRFLETFEGGYPSEKLLAHLDHLKSIGELQHIRIPGGTVSQDYSPIDGGGNWAFSGGLPLIEYIPLLKRINVPVIYVANLLKKDSIADTMYAINLLKFNGIKIIGVELGNETFAFPQRHGIKYTFVVDCTDKDLLNSFIADLKEHIDKIKVNYPSIKVSVPVAKPAKPALKRFNEEMFKLPVDAFSYHVYIDFGKEATQLKQYGNNISLFKSKGREVWITEYNMQFNNVVTNKNNYLSPVHMDMLYNKMPTLFKSKGCSIISRHSLWGNNKVSPFFPHITIDFKNNEFIIND